MNAFADADCPRLPSHVGVTVPLTERGGDLPQMILDMKVEHVLAWKSATVLHDHTLGEERKKSMRNWGPLRFILRVTAWLHISVCPFPCALFADSKLLDRVLAALTADTAGVLPSTVASFNIPMEQADWKRCAGWRTRLQRAPAAGRRHRQHRPYCVVVIVAPVFVQAEARGERPQVAAAIVAGEAVHGGRRLRHGRRRHGRGEWCAAPLLFSTALWRVPHCCCMCVQAKTLGMVHPQSQWLYVLTDTTSARDSLATYTSLLTEGDNVAFASNYTSRQPFCQASATGRMAESVSAGSARRVMPCIALFPDGDAVPRVRDAALVPGGAGPLGAGRAGHGDPGVRRGVGGDPAVEGGPRQHAAVPRQGE